MSPSGRPPTQYAPGTFGAWLQAKGFAQFKDVPALYQTMAKRLHLAGGRDVAPNSPILARFAQELNEPLKTLQAFAHHKPLADKWVKKIESQLARGTIPRGSQVAKRGMRGMRVRARKHGAHGAHGAVRARRRPGGRGTPCTLFLTERTGLPVRILADRVGMSRGTMGRLCAGQLAANHPMVTQLAAAIGVDVKQLAGYMHGPRMKEHTVGVMAGNMPRLKPLDRDGAKNAKGEPGTALVHVPREKGKAGKRVEKRTYNKLRSQQLALREAVRMLAGTLNVAAMRGLTVTEGPLPVRELHMILADYLDVKGVRANVLVDPDFATLFDPR